MPQVVNAQCCQDCHWYAAKRRIGKKAIAAGRDNRNGHVSPKYYVEAHTSVRASLVKETRSDYL